MKTIHKFSLEAAETQIIALPRGARLLTVQLQNDVICLWAEVDTERPTYRAHIEMVGTGHVMRSSMAVSQYLGTVQLHNRIVLHVYHQEL